MTLIPKFKAKLKKATSIVGFLIICRATSS